MMPVATQIIPFSQYLSILPSWLRQSSRLISQNRVPSSIWSTALVIQQTLLLSSVRRLPARSLPAFGALMTSAARTTKPHTLWGISGWLLIKVRALSLASARYGLSRTKTTPCTVRILGHTPEHLTQIQTTLIAAPAWHSSKQAKCLVLRETATTTPMVVLGPTLVITIQILHLRPICSPFRTTLP